MAQISHLSPAKSVGAKFNFSWQQIMLRIKDPKRTLPFYEQNFGMKLIHEYHFDEAKFSLYFLERPRDGEKVPSSSTGAESEKYLWSMKGVCLELTHNYGTEKDDHFCVNNGNEEPYRGFGHIAFNTNDLQAAVKKLQQNNVKFRKLPEEGRMHSIAFALDPDGYWIELCERASTSLHRQQEIKEEYNLSQAMLRIKDPSLSLPFYVEVLGMRLLREVHHEDFSLYFLASLPPDAASPDPKSEEAAQFVKQLWQPVVELTHNHGTEKDANFHYHNGNTEPQGFGHIGFLCDHLENACAELETAGVRFRKKPHEGKMRGIAFILDPDGYSIELIQRGVSF